MNDAIESFVPVTAGVWVGWSSCTFKRAPLPFVTRTPSVLIQPLRRYRENGRTATTAPQPMSAPPSDEMDTLRFPVRPTSAYWNSPRPPQV